VKGRNHFMPEGRDKQSGDSYVKTVYLNAKEDVLQVENWFNTCAGTIYRWRMILLGGGGPFFLQYAIWVVARNAYITAYINIKMGYSINCNSLYYMEPAGGIEPPTY